MAWAVLPSALAQTPELSASFGASRTVSLDVVVAAAPAPVFQLWTTPPGVRTFWAPDARLGSAAGERFERIFAPLTDPGGRVHGTAGAKILVYDPPRRLRVEWRGPPFATMMNTDPPATSVEVSIESLSAEPPRSVVRLRHDGFAVGADWDTCYDYYQTYWREVLDHLEAHVAGREATPDRGVGTNLPADLYVVIMRQGPRWVPGKPSSGQVGFVEHRAYMHELDRAGLIAFGGPFTDDPGALAVLRAGSLDDARLIAESDPAVLAGWRTVEVHPWRPVVFPTTVNP